MSERILAVYHTLLAAIAAYVLAWRGVDWGYMVTTVAMLSFVAYVKWEEYFRQRRDRRGGK
jgi:membrane protein implicated in regulation of membrane protease activity